MATATVTGPIYNLSQTYDFLTMHVVFELSHWDREENVGFMSAGPIIVPVDQTGNFSVDLAVNEQGEEDTHYQCFLQYQRTDGTEWIREPIGIFALGGPGNYRLDKLSFTRFDEKVPTVLDVYQRVLGLADFISGSDDSAFFTGNVYESVAVGEANTTENEQFMVPDLVNNEIARYRRDAVGSTEIARYITSGGINLYKEELRAAALAEVEDIKTSTQQIEGYNIIVDGNDNVLMRQRVDGIDFQPSDYLKGRMGQAASFAPNGTIYTRLEGSIFAYGLVNHQGIIDEYVVLNNQHLLRNQPTKGLAPFKMQAITTNGQSLSISFPFSDQNNYVDVREDDVWELDGLIRLDNPSIYMEARGALSQIYDYSVNVNSIRKGEIPVTSPTVTVPMCASLNDYRRKTGAPRASLLTVSHGFSGVSWHYIDSDPLTINPDPGGSNITSIFDNLTYWYQQCKNVVESMGGEFEVPAHVMVHGTSAKSEFSPVYYNFLDTYINDFRAMLATNNIGGEAKFFLTQSSGDMETTNGVLEPWDNKLDQLQMCLDGKAVLATPLYPYEVVDENVHPSGETTMLFSQAIAKAIAEEEAGNRWSSLGPTWYDVNGNEVTVYLDKRPDEVLVAHDPSRYNGEGISHYGFETEGANVVNVVIGHDRVRIFCDGTPTTIKYAMQVQDARSFTSTNYVAHRGLLRTSYSWKAKWTDDILYRWVPSFKINL